MLAYKSTTVMGLEVRGESGVARALAPEELICSWEDDEHELSRAVWSVSPCTASGACVELTALGFGSSVSAQFDDDEEDEDVAVPKKVLRGPHGTFLCPCSLLHV